eukprot:scaffold2592_cov395-Prasinococcus_capsulatus_cf.AAC.2
METQLSAIDHLARSTRFGGVYRRVGFWCMLRGHISCFFLGSLILCSVSLIVVAGQDRSQGFSLRTYWECASSILLVLQVYNNFFRSAKERKL